MWTSLRRGELAFPHDPLAPVIATLDPVLRLAVDLGKTSRHLEDPSRPVVTEGIEKGFTLACACARQDTNQIPDLEPMLPHERQVEPRRGAGRPQNTRSRAASLACSALRDRL